MTVRFELALLWPVEPALHRPSAFSSLGYRDEATVPNSAEGQDLGCPG